MFSNHANISYKNCVFIWSGIDVIELVYVIYSGKWKITAFFPSYTV